MSQFLMQSASLFTKLARHCFSSGRSWCRSVVSMLLMEFNGTRTTLDFESKKAVAKADRSSAKYFIWKGTSSDQTFDDHIWNLFWISPNSHKLLPKRVNHFCLAKTAGFVMIQRRWNRWSNRVNAPVTFQAYITNVFDDGLWKVVVNQTNCWNAKCVIHHTRWNEQTSKDLNLTSSIGLCSMDFSVFSRLYWEKGFTINHWAKTIILVTLMCVTGACAWVIIQVYVDPIIRVMTAGVAILIGYVCVKLLGENTVTAYQRAKVSSINIMPGDSTSEKLNTICQDVQCK